MKVILSVEPIRFPLTGIGRYTFELGRNLLQLKDVEDLKFYSGSEFLPALPDGSAKSLKAPVSPLLHVKRQVARIPFALELYRRYIKTSQRAALAPTSDYLYHGPNFYLPPTDGPSVVTIHDLSVLKLPEFHPPERVAFMEKEVALSIERATMIITVSDFIRHEIAAHFSLPLERIAVTHLGSSGDYFPRSEDVTSPVIKKLGLKAGGYTLYAGTIEPRKNLERLLSAYEALPPALRQRTPLVLAGYKGWNSSAIHARIKRATHEGWAKYLGYMPEHAFPHLFAGARLFAFPSLYEGFGLPILEAMASGVPVVCSDAASLPEVAGDAALLVSATDTDALRAALERGLTDEAWREPAIQNGLSQAARFSWQACARQTADVYAQALKVAA